MGYTSLIPELPEDIRGARIGTCYNVFTRKLMSDKIAIDPTKMDARTTKFVGGRGDLQLRANSSTSKNVKETFWGMNSTAKIGSWVSLGFSMSQAASEASSSSSLNCYCSFVYCGQKLILYSHEAETMFQYMTSDFQNAYIKIMEAPDNEERFKMYMKFIRQFGHGCVTELYLTSGSAFEISAHYSDQAKASEAKYNASIGVGSKWGGIEVVTSFANKVSQVDSKATVEIRASQLPENTPTKDWCADMMGNISSQVFSMLSKNPTPLTPYKGEMPVSPGIPKGNPDSKKIPKGSIPDFTVDLQKQLMAEDGFTGTWEQYQTKQRELYNNLSPQNVVSESLKNKQMLLNQRVDNVMHSGDVQTKTNSVQKKGALNSGSGSELGGYIPCDFEFKFWHELFPELKTVIQFQSLTTQYLSKAYMYYMTRLQFGSYLSLLADINTNITNNSMAKKDCAQFFKICDNLIGDISNRMSSVKSFGEKDYNAVIAGFEQSIVKLKEFRSNKIYNIFFENYDFFIDNLCGFAVANVKENWWTLITRSMRVPQHMDRKMELTELMEKGQRIYAVITPEGKFRMTAYARWNNVYSWHRVRDLPGGLKAIKETDSNGYTYYKYCFPFSQWEINWDDENVRLYGAGASILPAMEGFEMSGVPMIQPLDFEVIRSFANPDVR